MNYANVAYDLLPYNMESATLAIEGNNIYKQLAVYSVASWCSSVLTAVVRNV